MKPLALQLGKEGKRELRSLGWKRSKDGDCRRQFYALDDGRIPLVLSPIPAAPDWYSPGFPAVFVCEPFPEAVCVEISPCRLLAPPCYESREEAESQCYGEAVFDRWRAVYRQTHRQSLTLTSDDDGPLQERLDQWLSRVRADHDREKAVWLGRIERLKTGALQDLKLDSEEARQKRLAECREQLDFLESERPIEGVPCAGWLKLTLAEVKRGDAGIRDAWMHEQWAKANGEDLASMKREREVFRDWLETHTGTRAIITDTTAGHKREGVTPPRLGERFESNPQFLEACAKVRYRARFVDNGGTVIYLTDCEVREELTVEENEEVGSLTGERMLGSIHPGERILTKVEDVVELVKTGNDVLTTKIDQTHEVCIALAKEHVRVSHETAEGIWKTGEAIHQLKAIAGGFRAEQREANAQAAEGAKALTQKVDGLAAGQGETHEQLGNLCASVSDVSAQIETVKKSDLRSEFPNRSANYLIEFRGADYEVTFAGRQFSVPICAGMVYLVVFVRHQNKPEDPLALYAEAWGDQVTLRWKANPGSDPEEDGAERGLTSEQQEAWQQVRELKQMRDRRNQLEQLADKGASHLQQNEAWDASKEIELEDLRKQMGDPGEFNKHLVRLIRIATGKRMQMPNDCRKAQETMQRALNRLFQKLERSRKQMSPSSAAAQADFQEHFRERLMRNFLTHCYYETGPEVRWTLLC